MNLFKVNNNDGTPRPYWYGKIRLAPGKWSNRIRLYTDRRASESRLLELQKAQDQRATGVRTTELDRLGLPIKELAKLYIASLSAQGCNADHVRISEWMTDKLIELGQWQTFADISVDSMNRILAALQADGATASYRNKFVTRAKALVNWALPSDRPSPLAKLKRVRLKGAKKTRERRAASPAEAAKFFKRWPLLPFDRHLSYALAMLNGLRRNEIHRDNEHCLRWSQLHLDATIPFVTLPQKQGDDDDSIPLHPYIVALLRGRMAKMPGAAVVAAVPDVETLDGDLFEAGVEMKDDQGRRLDFHGLRHSFVSALDHTGASRSTKKALARHAAEDVTDGYAHADLSEMLTALVRIPSPTCPPATAKARATGTDGATVDAIANACGLKDQGKTQRLRQTSRKGASGRTSGVENTLSDPAACQKSQVGYNAHTCARTHTDAQAENAVSADGRKSWPSTQVGYGESAIFRANPMEKTQGKTQGKRPTPKKPENPQVLEPEAQDLFRNWPMLPKHIRAAILALAQAGLKE